LPRGIPREFAENEELIGHSAPLTTHGIHGEGAMKVQVKLLVGIAAAFSAFISLPAHAMVLEGSVQQSTVAPTTYTLQSAPQQQMQAPLARTQSQYQSQYQSQQTYYPTAAPQAHMAPQSGSPMLNAGISVAAKKEARAQAMQGVWQCVTQVTGSTVPGVTPGTVVRCEVQYVRDAQGNLLESWTENGWTPSTASVVKLDSEVITVSHVSSYASHGGTIKAQSMDAIKLVAPGTIVARGMVNQFTDGRFVGQYQTSSVLRKAS
jgi:hypothetical protein